MNNLALGSGKAALRRKINDAVGMMRIHRIRSQKKKLASPWAFDDRAVRKLLLTCFPKLQTDEGQRTRAAKWNRIIALFFRRNMSGSQVARELQVEVSTVESAIRNMRRAMAGRRTDTGRPKGGSRGRPKGGLKGC